MTVRWLAIAAVVIGGIIVGCWAVYPR